MNHNFSDVHNQLLAALIHLRFGQNEEATREAWKRLLQNDGWDDAAGKTEFSIMISKGLMDLSEFGFVEERFYFAHTSYKD